MLTEKVKNHVFYYRLLSILSEKSATITITIAIGGKWTFGHPCTSAQARSSGYIPTFSILERILTRKNYEVKNKSKLPPPPVEHNEKIRLRK